jgi:hypothetical protein
LAPVELGGGLRAVQVSGNVPVGLALYSIRIWPGGVRGWI